MRIRFGLREVLGASLVGLLLLLAALFSLLYGGSRQAIVQTSDRLRAQASREIEGMVERFLSRAEHAMDNVDSDLRLGVLRPGDPIALETDFYQALSHDHELNEITLTYGKAVGRWQIAVGSHQPGDIRLARQGRGQLSVFRDANGALTTLFEHQTRKGFETEVRRRRPGGALFSSLLLTDPFEPPDDPTRHLTFTTPANAAFYGQAVWSDLHWSQRDLSLPPEKRRVVVTLQEALQNGAGRFVGVLRVGLSTEQLDEIPQLRLGGDPNDAHRIFLCDSQGRLITRLQRGDTFAASGDDLRVQARQPPPFITAALHYPGLAQVDAAHPEITGTTVAEGERLMLTFRFLHNTQDWIVGIVVPEQFYLGRLLATRNRLLVASCIVMAGILLVGGLTVEAFRHALGRIVRDAESMQRFDFSPRDDHARLREVQAVLDGLSHARTAMRALCKYVPVDLVRQLFTENREPVLGGKETRVTLLFSDIQSFTSFAENMEPNELARALGDYLAAMTAAIHRERGTIDKYIGDAVMALWNTPSPCPDHAVHACRAALACVEATRGLYDAPAWDGRPQWKTRIGIHQDVVVAGHFGSPDRMSFTCMGDGVNLASRLEGLNKQYGTYLMVSQAVVDEAGSAFEFRLLDAVEVKGRTHGVRVYELLGEKGRVEAALVQTARRYEEALAAYWDRDFGSALAMLALQEEDPPSRVLAERCRQLQSSPPPPDWDGVYVATSK